MPLLRRIPNAVGVLLAGPGFILTPWLFLTITRITLFPIFGETHDFRADWYLHVVDFSSFLFGFAIAKHEPFFERCMKWRWPALAIGLVSWAALMLFYASYPGDAAPPDWQRVIFRGVRESQAWFAIVAAFGFASRYLRNADGPVRRYLTTAIFPFYLIHQTAIVVAAHYLDEIRLPLAVEAPLLISITLLACLATYELARRVPFLSPWLGVSSKKPKTHPTYAARAANEAA